MMMLRYTLACSILLVSLPVLAQLTNPIKADAEKLMSRILIVELDEEDPKAIKRLTKKEKKNPGGVAVYRNNIKLSNHTLYSAIF